MARPTSVLLQIIREAHRLCDEGQLAKTTVKYKKQLNLLKGEEET